MQNENSKETIELIKELNVSTAETFQPNDENLEKSYIYLTFFNSKTYRYFRIIFSLIFFLLFKN